MNSNIINILEEMRYMADITGEVYKEKAYSLAINNIKKLDYKITLDNINNKINRVGEGIKDKIIEFLNTGSIAELEQLKNSKEYIAYQKFNKIIGVGPATIKKWIKLKVYNMGDLNEAIKEGKIKLNHAQQLGLKYYDDLNSRIPRAEVESIGNHIKHILQHICDAEFVIAGSYRRGLPTSGDIDILISIDNAKLDDLFQAIKKDKNYIDVINSGPERLTFLYKSTQVRQVDILNIPKDNFAAALLYFTGSYSFNQAMRGYAKMKGYRLNQNGLYKYNNSNASNTSNNKELVLIPAQSEKEIFDHLGLKYIDPADRIDEKSIIAKV